MVNTLNQLKMVGKTKIYGEDSMTAGEAVAFILGVMMIYWGNKLPLPSFIKKYADYIGVAILFVGFLLW